MTKCLRSSAGFTLIEMIMVITITGVIAGMVAVFIRAPVQGYVDLVRRAELTDQADVALRRIARDVRLALPNSLRTVTNGFEFIITKSGGRYRDVGDGSTGGNFLSFTSSATTFDVLGPAPAMNGGDRIVVYNLGTGYSPADAYSGFNVAILSGSGAITANPVSMSSNPFYLQSPIMPSPSGRFQVVDQSDLVVRYVCNGQTLTRFSGCTLATPSACSGSGALLAGAATGEPTAACTIDYASAATGRSGLLYVSLTLTKQGESVTLFNQIHVDNTP
jgi:MSHA biogenesis protein MshO